MTNKIKVCHISSAHNASDIRIFHKECKSLAKAGYDVTLIAQHDKNENVDGVNIIALPKPRNRFHRMFGITNRLLILAIKQNADIYHFHDPELIPAGVILKIWEKKVIYDVHEDYPKSILAREYLPKSLKKYFSMGMNFIEKYVTRSFDMIVTATDNIKKNFQNDRVIVIHNYPFIVDFGLVSEKTDNIFRIIYPGPICELRGIKQILVALECINNNIKLILIGNFVSASFENEVKSFKTWDKVEYMGVLPHKDVMKNLTKADLGIECSFPTPNYLYSESNKIFEYMSVGLPVLCSNLPRIKEIVEGSKCGICVNPLDTQAIANSIEYLMNNPNLRKELGENGRKAILEKYNWEKEKLLEAYNKVLE